MKRFLQCIILSMVIVSISFGIYKFSKGYDLDLIYENIDWSIVNKSVNGAVSFDFDREDNLYIAFKDAIKVITKDNNEEIVISDKSLNIYDIVCNSNSLIIATENKNVINELKENRCPSLTKGEQVWDYLYSYDAADAMIKAAIKGKDGSIYCLGSGEKRLLKDYIKDIAEVVNPNVQLSFGQKPYGENQVMFLSADITKLKEDTGFIPKYDFKQAIKEIVGKLN